jgi:tRNA(Arg) A34 adenosine deaminase TadA
MVVTDISHDRFMREAITLSKANVREGKGGPFAAIVVKDGKVLARGTNRVTATNDPTAHAEIVAIREACGLLGSFQLDNCEIYTSCEPCPMCLGAIYWARPRAIYFANTRDDAASIGFDDRFIYDEFAVPHTARKIPMVQILRDEALEVFRDWNATTNKVLY